MAIMRLTIQTNALTVFWLMSSILIFIFFLLMRLTSNYGGCLCSYLKTLSLFGKLKQADDNKNKTNLKSNVNGRQDTGSNSSRAVAVLMVPKSWFSHFYAVGALVHSVVLFSCLIAVLLGKPLPHVIQNLIYWIRLGSDQDNLNCNAWPLVIVFCLEYVQMLRRLYECLFISTFSKSVINVLHYFYGIFIYSSFGIGLLSSVNLEKLVFPYPGGVEIICYLLGISLFVWGSYYQHKSMLTFASLRKKQKGHRPDDHYIPHGHLFEWVSCPHYLCEMLIYLSFCLIFQFSNMYIISVAVFVLTNQGCVSILVHKWYQEHFLSYPKLRAAFLPYIL